MKTKLEQIIELANRLRLHEEQTEDETAKQYTDLWSCRHILHFEDEKGEVIAFLSWYRSIVPNQKEIEIDEQNRGNYFYVHSLYVHPDYDGQEIIRQFINDNKQIYKNCTHFVWNIRKRNERLVVRRIKDGIKKNKSEGGAGSSTCADSSTCTHSFASTY